MAIDFLPIASATLLFVICFTLSTYTLRTFLSFQRTPFYVYLCSWIGYFLSISVIFLVPLDVAVTSYLTCEAVAQNTSLANISGVVWTDPVLGNLTNDTGKCDRPFNYIPPAHLEILWNCIYWSASVATWVVFPLLQSYVVSGEFTFLAKVKATLKENVIMGAVAIAVCFVLWLIIFFGFNEEKNAMIIQAVVTAGGMWGITVLVCLLGYGLVFVPRKYWRMGDRHTSLMRLQNTLAGLYDEVEDYGFILEETLKVVKKFDNAIGDDASLREHMDKVISHVPKEYGAIKSESNEDIIADLPNLVRLHERLMWDSHRYSTAVILFGETFKEVVAMDDVINSRQGGWKKRIHYSLEETPTGFWGKVCSELDWLWSLVSPILYRVIAILCLLMSLTLLYSEMILFHFPQFSFWAYIIDFCRGSSVVLQAVCLLVLSYVGLCCYSGLFQLKLFSFYQLVPHQQTDENSILFSAAYLSRLVAPIALNFLHVINFTSTTVKSPFMRMISVASKDPIQETLYAYIPLFLLIICIATVFDLGNKFMTCIGLARVCCSDEFDEAMIDQGRGVMEREKEARKRGGTTLRGVARTLQHGSNSRRTEKRDELSDMIKEVDISEPSLLQKGFGWFGSLLGTLNTDGNNKPRRISQSGSDIQFTLRDTSISSEPESTSKTRSRRQSSDAGELKSKGVGSSGWGSSANPFDYITPTTPKSSWEDDEVIQLAPKSKYAWEDSSSDDL
eukprot:TRINITY_DN6175_c0_g1_i1.p1 TRINITY_DN6175_c0_g1~~TRINITY_DN6175_c0_g1_i1.p1  ORF type:complete len:731 (-),score=115.52 TRINITY_DN6175_c0_g1_i1:416-2608(-)